MQADHQVPDRGHDLRAAPDVDLRQVLGEGHIAHPVQAVLDLPVPPDPGGELVGSGLVRGEVGDRVHGLSRASSFSPLAARSSPHWWPDTSPRRRPDSSPPRVDLAQVKAVTPLPDVA